MAIPSQWRQPFHPALHLPRLDLTQRYISILTSIVVIMFVYPYVFRRLPDPAMYPDDGNQPYDVANAYRVLSGLFGYCLTSLTLLISLYRISLLHFHPARDPSTPSPTSSSSTPRKLALKYLLSRTTQDASLLVLWILALVWWNVARALWYKSQHESSNDVAEIVLSLLCAGQIALLSFSVWIARANSKSLKAGDDCWVELAG